MHIPFEIRNQTFSYSSLGDDFHFPLHMHRQCELVYIKKGGIRILTRDGERLLHDGELALFFPLTPHGYRAEGKNEGMLMIFDPSFVPDFTRSLTEKKPERNYLEQSEVHEDIHYLLLSLLRDDTGNISRQRAALSIVLSHFFEMIQLHGDMEAQVREDTLYRLLSFLYDHFLEDISLHDTAEFLGVSPYYLSHIFSNKIGSGFLPYLHSLRVDHACELLRTTNRSVTQIAYDSGFASVATFHRVFQDRKGVSPLRFRKSLS